MASALPGRTPACSSGAASVARGLAALAAGLPLLLSVAAAARAAALAALAGAAAVAVLAALARRVRRVGDLRGALLAHALLAQPFVLLVVLDARTVVLGHAGAPLGRTCLTGGVPTRPTATSGRRPRRRRSAARWRGAAAMSSGRLCRLAT